MSDVVCVGIIVADVLGRPVEALPARGTLMLVDKMELHIGGCASNTAIGLSRIGISSSVIGKVGKDGFGDFVVKYMQQQGVEVSGVVRDEREFTSATMVLVHADGERSFIHYLGANAALNEENIDFSIIQKARLLHVAGALVLPSLDGEPMARLLKKARAAGLTTALDTVWDAQNRWMKALKPALEFVDYFLPSFEEAKMLTGQETPEEVAAALLDKGVGTVALKLAEQGCYVRTREAEIRAPAYEIQCLDATGAGDAFVAGFLAGVLKGWDLEKTARFANAVGALACLAIGTTNGVRSLEETLEFQENTPFIN